MPEQLPQWNAVGVEPPQSLKDSGWQPGMKPSAQHMNWLLNRAYKCIEELQQAGGNVDDLTQTVENIEETVDSLKQTVNSNSLKIDTHIKDDEGHTRWFGNATGTNAKTIITTKPLPIDSNGDPINGASFRFMNSTANTGAVTMFVTHANGTTKTYPVYNNGIQLKAGDLPSTTVHTVTFAGGSFHLQGKGGVMTSGTQNYIPYTAPGTYSFTVPEGVTRITAFMRGSGGGGGGANTTYGYGGGGGGSGASKRVLLQVTPGMKLVLTVAKGGTGGEFGTAGGGQYGENGAVSSITGAQNGAFYAHGGGGGMGGQQSFGGYGGAGGQDVNNGPSGTISPTFTRSDGGPVAQVDASMSKVLSSLTGGHGIYGRIMWGGGGGGSPSDSNGGLMAGAGETYYGGLAQNQKFYFAGSAGGYGAGTGEGQQHGINGSGGAGGNSSYPNAKNGGNGGDGLICLMW
ncbi:glycine-rich domain-containing protein [Lysinibacillus sp. OF-1]|uniref:glycine-rich domain-containing protein n=1 Tax=Lysinibacillus sp. OF-1 TaxID=2972483 RepID=UPI00232F7CB7|nr:hypothetical protein [Lysinibacillus sp. OF-1]WCH45793.1 hypothetical protein NV349_11810 [Lysinibacillus sp. OF-1]